MLRWPAPGVSCTSETAGSMRSGPCRGVVVVVWHEAWWNTCLPLPITVMRGLRLCNRRQWRSPFTGRWVSNPSGGTRNGYAGDEMPARTMPSGPVRRQQRRTPRALTWTSVACGCETTDLPGGRFPRRPCEDNLRTPGPRLCPGNPWTPGLGNLRLIRTRFVEGHRNWSAYSTRGALGGKELGPRSASICRRGVVDLRRPPGVRAPGRDQRDVLRCTGRMFSPHMFGATTALLPPPAHLAARCCLCPAAVSDAPMSGMCPA